MLAEPLLILRRHWHFDCRAICCIQDLPRACVHRLTVVSFGVSRVFSQQCAYVLTDMQSLRDKMRGISVLLKELETDPDVATTR